MTACVPVEGMEDLWAVGEDSIVIETKEGRQVETCRPSF